MRGPRAVALVEKRAVVRFKAGEGSIEHFPARHNDDVERGCDLVAPEHFSRQALDAVSFDGRPQLPGRCYAQPRGPSAVRNDEDGHETALKPKSGVVRALEVRPMSNPLGAAQRLSACCHRSSTAGKDVAVERQVSALVGNRETFSPLCPAALQHDPAVLRRHSNPKPVRLLPAADVRLISALSLHPWSCEAARWAPIREPDVCQATWR
jgi:hypothetical protein